MIKIIWKCLMIKILRGKTKLFDNQLRKYQYLKIRKNITYNEAENKQNQII